MSEPVDTPLLDAGMAFLKTMEVFAEAAKDIEVILPAVVVLARMAYLRSVSGDANFESKKELAYLIEREIIGAWVVKNSNSPVGEGAGVALMAIAPFAPDIGEMIAKAPGDAKEAFALTNDLQFDKFLELQEKKSSESPKRFFFEYIRRNPNLNFDENIQFFLDKMYDGFKFKSSKNLLSNEITETLRILTKIFYRIKNCDSLEGFYNYFNNFKKQGIIQTDLSLRKSQVVYVETILDN